MKPITLFALLLLQTVSVAQQNPPLTVFIATATPVVESGAEIRINVTVTNTTNHPIRIMKALGSDGQAESVNHFEVYDADGIGAPSKHRPQTWMSSKGVLLNPGKSLEDFSTITDLFDLSKPGKYTVVARHEFFARNDAQPSVQRILVPSNTITIAVNASGK